MSNLFNLKNDLLEMMNAIIENGGEINQEQEEALKVTEHNYLVKSQNYVQVIKSIEGDINVIDQEIKRLQHLKKVRTNTIERLENSLKESMRQLEFNEIQTPLYKISVRKSQSVNVIDENILPNEYAIFSKKADKNKIKDAIKKGLTVDGASLVENTSIQIK